MSAASSRIRASLLFAGALFVRACFWLATPDRTSPNSIAYEGDTPKWLSFVNPPEGDIQLALPLHPPGMIWLSSWLTDGSSFAFARAAMVLLGALLAPLMYLLVRRGLSEGVALLTGCWCAVSSGLVQLGSGLHSEIPYLVLFVSGLFALDNLRQRTSYGSAVLFGVTQAMACFFRVDHLAYVAFAIAWLALTARPHGVKGSLVAVATMLAVFAPWQWQASTMIERANVHGFPGRAPGPLPPPNGLAWDDDALAAVRAMPAFAHDMTVRFVQDIVALQGGTRVTADDLSVLDDAYGYRPEPLSTPLLAMYGPMNFCLGNYSKEHGGFSRAALDHPPPLAGSVGPLVRSLEALPPNGSFNFDYPPHLRIINHGYHIGLERWMAKPSWVLSLIADKLQIAWRGVAAGFGNYAAPLGMSLVRESVDITVAMGSMASLWRALLLALAVVGIWVARKSKIAIPLVLFALAKFLTVALFFGYARFGAMCIPAFAVLWALALDRLFGNWMSGSWGCRFLWALLTLLVVCEGARCLLSDAPSLVADGQQQGPILGRHERVFVEYR